MATFPNGANIFPAIVFNTAQNKGILLAANGSVKFLDEADETLPSIALEWHGDNSITIDELRTALRLRLPIYTASTIPVASSNREGELIYVQDTDVVMVCDGIEWTALTLGNLNFSFLPGSVLFGGAGGGIADDDTGSIMYDEAIKRLKIARNVHTGSDIGPQADGTFFAFLDPNDDANGHQAGLFQIRSGSITPGIVTIGNDHVAVSGWSFRGSDSSVPLYGGNFGVVFDSTGVANGVEIDVQNNTTTTGHGQGLWINGSGVAPFTGHRSNAILIDTQDPTKWTNGILFKEGHLGGAGGGATGSILEKGIYFSRSHSNDFIVIQPRTAEQGVAIKITDIDFTFNKFEVEKDGVVRGWGAGGSAGFPTFSFTDDPNTGMYRVLADQIGLTVGGSNRVLVAPSGVFTSVPLHLTADTPLTGELRFMEDSANGFNYVGFKARTALPSGNQIWALPEVDGTTGQALTTDGAGNLAFASVSGGSGTVTSVTGTANQVIASPTTGAVVLTTPQNIHTGAVPTFSGITILSEGDIGGVGTFTGARIDLLPDGSSVAQFSMTDTAGGEFIRFETHPTMTASATYRWPGTAGTAGQVLTTDGAAPSQLSWETPSGGGGVPSMTAGSVVFSTGGTNLGQDNANFFWDDTNNRLGLGTSAPGSTLHVLSAAGSVLETSTAATNTIATSLVITHRTSAASDVGFGTALFFQHRDSSSTTEVAELRTTRGSADDTASFAIRTKIGGTMADRFVINTDGQAVYTPTSSVGTFGFAANGTRRTEVQFHTNNNTNAVSMIAPASATGNHIWTLPSTLGAANTVLTNDGAGTLSWTTAGIPAFTIGSVVFAGSGGLLTEDNPNFFWDDVNNRLGLGLGAVAPNTVLHVGGSGNAVARFDRVSSSASSSSSATRLHHRTTVNMADGHGVEMAMSIEDDTPGVNTIANLVAKRAGADSTGSFAIQTAISGTLADRFTVNGTGQATYWPTASTGSFQLAANGTRRTELQFFTNSNTNAVSFIAPATSLGNHVWTLPQNMGAAKSTLTNTDGAGALSWASGLRVYNVRDYGALGNDSANDRAAIQAAADDMCGVSTTDKGGILYFPAGRYRIGSAVNLNCGMIVTGDGYGETASFGGTRIITTNATQNGFVVEAANQVIIERMAIGTSVTKTDGAAIRLQGGGTATICGTSNPGFRLYDVLIHNHTDGVLLAPSTLATCVADLERIFVYTDAGVGRYGIANHSNGFAYLRNSFIIVQGLSAIAVDGIDNLTGNFIHGKGPTTVRLAATGGTIKEGLWYTHNIIEQTDTTPGKLSMDISANLSQVDGMFMVMITANEFYAPTTGLKFATTGGIGKINGVSITGNAFRLQDGTGACIDINNMYNAVISGNSFESYPAGGSTTTGVRIREDTSLINVGPNTYGPGIETHINSTSSNSSSISVTGGHIDVTGNITHFANWKLAGATRFAVEETGTTIINDTDNGLYQLAIGNTGNNGAAIILSGTSGGATSPNKWLRSLNNKFEIVNSAHSAVLFSLNESGLTDSVGGFAAAGQAGITATVTVAHCGGSGTSGTLQFAGGILIARTGGCA